VSDAVGSSPIALFWTAVGVIGALIFYGRFYVQWIASELKKRSVVPIAFWYMSSCGSVMLLAFAVWSQSPLGALGQNINIVIYSRNLIHIWRNDGRLTKRVHALVHGAVALIACVALGFAGLTWYREYQITQELSSEAAARNWLWLGVGVVGQSLFAIRFLIQWIATERKRESVIPTIFWHLSIVAAALQCVVFFQRHEWIFATGMAASIVIYCRNLWLIYSHSEKAKTLATNG
jgi:lipid-A-disaccharide synthase-like uncharacterized protein